MDIFRVPASVRDLAIERFPLTTPIYNTLKLAKIDTFEGLVNTLRAGQTLLNKKQKGSVKAIVTNFHLSLDANGLPDWKAFCERQGIPVLPSNVSIESDAEILKGLSSIIEEILTFGAAEGKKWQTIQYRFGLNGKNVLTLDELGQAFGKITREAIRLVEKKSLIELRQTLLEENYACKGYQVDQRIVEFVKKVSELTTNEQSDFIVENDFILELASTSAVSIDGNISVLRLLFQIFGMSQIKDLPEGLPAVWKINKSFPEAKLRKSLAKINSLLTSDYLPPIDEIELLAKINRAMGRTESLSLGDLHRYLTFCDFVETTEDGKYQAKFEKINSRAGQAESLLVEAGEPVEVKEIVRQFNQRLTAAGLKKVEYLNIANIMSSDKRFVSEANSGRRALKRWNLENKTILEQMEAALNTFGRSATDVEIYEFVKSKRPVSLASIRIYLSGEKRFSSDGLGKWRLAVWQKRDDEVLWTNKEIGESVEGEFIERGVKEMPYPEIVGFLATKMGIEQIKARGILKHHPVVKSRRLDNYGRTIAILNLDYKAELNATKPKRKRRKETLYKKAETFVKQLLMQDPAKEIELSSLRAKLVSELGLQKQTAYQYISKMEFIKKIPVEGSTVRICKLKGVHSAVYPKVADIKRVNLRSGEEAERAIAKLNEADVDIGLFMLGRLFESSLKSYLLAEKERGILEIGDGNINKLNNMIQWIKKENIVSDAPTLSYLQAQRNDRAHGEAPNLEERQRMLESAPWGANLYLTYILLFETKRKEVSNG